MKRLLETVAILLTLGTVGFAQTGYPNSTPQYDPQYDRGYGGQWQGKMSEHDQHEFNEEYAKWQEAKNKNDTHGIDKHARKMEEIMARYNIPRDTPFDAIATPNEYSHHYDARQFQGRFSPDDQKEFDKQYEHWLKDRQKGDRDDIAKDEGKMQEIMARNNIPRDVPYNLLASGGRGD